MDVFDLFAKISIDTSEYENGLNDASGKTSSFSDSLKAAGQAISATGTTLTNNVSLPLLSIGKNILQAGMEYEAGMDEVMAISGATGEEIALLGDKAMEMASKTKFSTAESAEAYKYMAMAGWETEDMLNAISAVMYLAGASGESLASTSDIVTDAMTAFGLAADGNSKVLKDGYEVEVSNAQRFTDVLAAASNNANTNVSMMGETFKYVAPVAGAMGYTIEDVAVAAGLMANSGIKASMAGTALRTLFVNMSNPTDAMASAMARLGLSLEDDEGRMYSLMEIMEQLRAGFNGGSMDSAEFASALSEIQTAFENGELSEVDYEIALNNLASQMYGVEGAEKAQLAAMLEGKYGMAGLLAIVSASDDDFNSLTEAIYNSNGATEEMYNIMTDNAQGAVTMLDSAINVLYTSLSEFIIPAFTDIVRWVTDVVNSFNALDDDTKKLILTIGGIAIAVGPVLTVIGNIITAVGTIGGAIGGLIDVVGKAGTAISGLFSILAANPIALVIAAVAALVAGIIVLWNTNEDFRNAVGAIWEAIKGFFVGAWEAIKAAWGAAGEFFGGIVDGIKGVFDGIGDFLGGLFESAWEAVQNAWNAAVEFFSGIGEGIHEAFETVTSFLGEAFSAAWDAITAVWDGAVEFFGGIWDNVKTAAGEAADKIGSALSGAWDAVTSAWDGAMDFFGGVWDSIKDVFSNAWEAFSDIGGNIVKGIWDGISGAAGWLWDQVSGFFGGFVDGVRDFFGIHSPSTVFAEIGEFMMQGLDDGIEDESGSVDDRLASVSESMINAFSNLAEQYGAIGKDALQTMADAFSSAPQVFTEIGQNAINALSNGLGATITNLQNKVSGLMNSITAAAKSALGIHSPSKVFASIGENMALGLGEGWDDEYSNIKRQITNGLDFATASVGLVADGAYNPSWQAQNGPQAAFGGAGNTYVTINSPVAVDAVTAAREWKKTTQRMAMGYV